MALVREALELAAGSAQIRIHLNPEDRQALGRQVQMLVQEMSGLGAAEMIADAGCRRGGCRVETRFGTIDQQFEAQLARIEEELTVNADADFTEQLDALMPTALTGTVAQTVGMTIAAAGFPAPVGAVAEIQREAGAAAAGRGDRLPRRADAAVSLQRPGRHPPRQSRAAGADQPLAAGRRRACWGG